MTANATSLDEEGNFLMFVTPPSLDQVQQFFTRNMIFLIDRSGMLLLGCVVIGSVFQWLSTRIGDMVHECEVCSM